MMFICRKQHLLFSCVISVEDVVPNARPERYRSDSETIRVRVGSADRFSATDSLLVGVRRGHARQISNELTLMALWGTMGRGTGGEQIFSNPGERTGRREEV